MIHPLVYRRLSLSLQVILLIQMAVAMLERQWPTAFFSFTIVLLTVIPLFVAQRLKIYIPPQFQMLAIATVFAALFLGEIRGYYTRFEWWDNLLHATTGALMGIVGFLLVYIFVEIRKPVIRAQAFFLAFFAFCFALTMGAAWEVMEYVVDRIWQTQLQKPTPGDPSGLTDTMVDLAIDASAALAISIFGFFHLNRSAKPSFLERWIFAFIRNNPKLFHYWRN